jgi:hypothetical protein
MPSCMHHLVSFTHLRALAHVLCSTCSTPAIAVLSMNIHNESPSSAVSLEWSSEVRCFDLDLQAFPLHCGLGGSSPMLMIQTTQPPKNIHALPVNLLAQYHYA